MNKLFFYWLVVFLHSVLNMFLWFGWIFNNKLIKNMSLSTKSEQFLYAHLIPRHFVYFEI